MTFINRRSRSSISKNVRRWFGLVERMSDERIVKNIYEERVRAKKGKIKETSVALRKQCQSVDDTVGRSREKHEDSRRACVNRFLTGDEAKKCRNRSVWCSLLSGYQNN